MKQGIVLYTDGGARPSSRGPAGWGYHGYTYCTEEPKKGMGTSFSITNLGYQPKGIKGANPVTLVNVLEGYGSLPDPDSTNNLAELTGAINGLRIAAQYPVESVLIYSDSKYTVQGSTEWVKGWQRNNWVKNDGTEVSNAQTWQELVDARKVLEDRGIKVKFQWLKGHDGQVGNELADVYATMAVLRAQAGSNAVMSKVIDPTEYWKYSADRHPFITHQRMYIFISEASKPSNKYYLGAHGAEDDQFAKKISDGAFSVVELDEADEVLDYLKQKLNEDTTNGDSIAQVRLEKLYDPTVHRIVDEHRQDALIRIDRNRLDYNFLDDEPLIHEFRPVRLAYRAFDVIEELDELLTKVLADANPSNGEYVTTDITDRLFDKLSKPGRKKADPPVEYIELKKEYNTGFAVLPVTGRYKTELASGEVDFRLTLGIDLMDRNSLKRIEGLDPKVLLVTWAQGPALLRYATVVTCSNARGIWAGVYSNTRIVGTPE